MSKSKKFDFSGYATKVGLKCSDGRTILQDAFQENDGATVPLVWAHMHNEPGNILGHAKLENRKDGVYAYCSLNNSVNAQTAKEAIAHGDITALSIYANSLVEKGKNVIHGMIREVSLVIAGANPEAYIDNLAFEHGDGSVVTDETEAIICANLELEHSAEDDDDDEPLKHADSKKTEDDKTLGDVFETMNEEQKTVVYAMLEHALATSGKEDTSDGAKHSNIKGEDSTMKKNVFDKATDDNKKQTLSHDALTAILADAKSCGSLKEAFLKHDYGIENIDFLFPDAKTVTPTPAFIKRETGWVKDVFNASHHTPFSRIKSVLADITGDEARARGYVKGNLKVEEVITLLKRTTNPTTVYKKQKLDRDDIVDITDFDVVAWLKLEMRMMLEEELARAILVGDGRSSASDDKIKEDCIRPIYKDDDLYAVKVLVPASSTTAQTIDAIILARKDYKGSGNPTFFSTPDNVGEMLLLKDSTGRRLYNTINDLAAALRVTKIVEVPVLENLTRVITPPTSTVAGAGADLLGIVVNMQDYYVGADKGGAVNMFDDFDIDYNQFKYLIETRCSGALVLPGSALIIEKATVIPATGV